MNAWDRLNRIEDAVRAQSPELVSEGELLALVEVARSVYENAWMGGDQKVKRDDLKRAWRQTSALLYQLLLAEYVPATKKTYG